MKDVIVANSLRARGFDGSNMEELLQYEAIERMARVLDKPPKKLSFTKSSNTSVYGCCAEFILCYNNIKSGIKLEQAVLDLPNSRRYCDIEVFIALQALIQQGFTMIADRAVACFEVFKVIAMTKGDVLTVQRVGASLTAYVPKNYYEGELIKALQVCILNEKSSVVYWVGMCEYIGYYSRAIELGKDVIRSKCSTEKEVAEFLCPLYKEAKQDKEFMESLYKPAVNKWLIPMIYYLHKDYPEVLNSQ